MVREGTSDKISYMIFSKVLYSNGVAKISVGGSKNVVTKDVLKNFENVLKHLLKNLINFPKFCKIKI